MSIVPVQQETAPVGALMIDETDLMAVTDLWERARLADEVIAQLQRRAAVALGVRRDAVRELVRCGAAQNHIARHIGLTPSRISQLIAPSGPRRTAKAVAA